jgi:NAD-dependent deacetylase
VWFGETLPEAALSRAYQASEEHDVMLIVGTSGVVHPAAALPAVAKGAGKTVIEVNPEPSGITPYADLILQGPGGEALPRLVERVRQAKCTRAVAATGSTS